MITEWEVYWITRMDWIIGLFITGGVLGIILSAVLTICWYFDWCDKDARKLFRSRIKHPCLVGIIGCILLVVSGFVPSTKATCAIKIIPLIVNNKKVADLPDKILDLAGAWMEKLSPKTREK